MLPFNLHIQKETATMRTAAKVAEDYITAWNEFDAPRRRAILESTWTPTATYVDPVAKGTGLVEIDNIIGSVQRRFPDFMFSLSGNADGHANVVRFSWALGPREGAAVIKGTDFVARDGDKIAAVTGFLDLMPAPA
jgi:SnoaL-like domain